MEAYKVWVTLNLKGDALKRMEMFTAATKRATAAVDKLKIAMKPNVGMFDHMAVNLREINPQLNAMAKNINSIDRASTRLNRNKSSSKFDKGLMGSLALYNPAMMAGAAVGGTFVGGFNKYGKLQTQSNQLGAQGFSQADTALGIAAAQNIRIAGISQNDMLKAIIDIANATGNMSQAIKYGPSLAKASLANLINVGKTFSPAQEARMIQFAELRGGSDPAKVFKSLDLAEQAFSATSGRIMPSELLNFSKMAVTAGYKLSENGLLQLIPTLQELGGFRTGTGFQMGYNRLIAGVGLLRNKKVVAEGQRIGLLNKSGRLSDENAEIYASNPVQFWEKVLKPIYAKAGINSDIAVSRENAFLLGTTPARFFDTIRKNEAKSDRMLPLHQNAWGIDNAFLKALNTNPGELKKLTSSFENFEIALGKFSSPAINVGIEVITKFLNFSASVLTAVGAINQKYPGGSFGAAPIGGVGITDPTAGASNRNNSKEGHVYLEGNKVGKIIFGGAGSSLYGNTFVSHSTSTPNPLMPYSSSYAGSNN